ncbi:uncharacterized protein LOC131209697 [Anopheles bellator]|uniref:uncharacterized protein LOC131209697 n=1 Tax=Anopheles bellator TaxID=139047 RepID=UPI002648CFE3|nr:uncharacterized protein LOC131209697 [Anopheles bellator]
MGNDRDLNSTQNLVHPDWEILDPTPDIFALFPLFDRKFFQGKLGCVQLEWSKKMYNCAGICYQRSNRMGKSCIIRLSEPLLKLRPRKDLVQTLLHEMIHAYCFVLGIREGNGGHGPTFKKIMNGINKIAGTHITVYHTFHDEVNIYKTHWWKCNGPCQHKHPFYGVVKRTANRKPGPSDFWWKEHNLTCGGEFVKIREPSPKRKITKNKENPPGFFTPSQKKKPEPSSSKSISNSPQKNLISNYYNNTTTYGTGSPANAPSSARSVRKPMYTPGVKPNFGGGTLVIRKPPSTVVAKPVPVTPKVEKPTTAAPTLSSHRPQAEGNLRNVVQLKDIKIDDEEANPRKPSGSPIGPLFAGHGYTLGSSSNGERRSRLLDQFPTPKIKPLQPKRARTEDTISVDSVLLSDDSDDLFDAIDPTEVERTVAKIKMERQDAIKKEIIDSFAGDEIDDIVLIDDDYEDELVDEELASMDGSLLDRSVIDDLFNDNDELIEDYNRTNAKIKTENVDDEIVSCPTCFKKIARKSVGDHLEHCFSTIAEGIDRGDNSEKAFVKRESDTIRPSTSKATQERTKPVIKQEMHESTVTSGSDAHEARRQLLLDCGYTDDYIASVLNDCADDLPTPDLSSLLRESGITEEDIARALHGSSRDDSLEDDVEFVSNVDSCDCPSCGKAVNLAHINQHLDQCLFK